MEGQAAVLDVFDGIPVCSHRVEELCRTPEAVAALIKFKALGGNIQALAINRKYWLRNLREKDLDILVEMTIREAVAILPKK